MAIVNGVSYQKEWVNDPSEQADKGTTNARTVNVYEEASGIASGDVVKLYKLQHGARFIGVEALVGTLGASLRATDKNGASVALVAGDFVDGQVEGGLDIELLAAGPTSASLKVLIKFLMD